MTAISDRDPARPRPTLLDAELRVRLRQAVESYAERGRRFDALDEEVLARRYVMAIKAWCRYPRHPDTGREVNDVSAEYLLCGKDVSLEKVAADVVCVFPVIAASEETKAVRDREPLVTIACVVFESHPMLYVPRLGPALLAPMTEEDRCSFARRDAEEAARKAAR